MTEYPEHTKLKAIVTTSNAIGTFLDWLREQEPSIVLCSEHTHEEPEDGVDGGCYAAALPDAWQDPPGSGRTRICGTKEGSYEPVRSTHSGRPLFESLLARYFEIDPTKIDAEKDAMVEELRAATRESGPGHPRH